MTGAPPDGLAQAATGRIGAWCAENPAGGWLAEQAFERGRFGPYWDETVQVTYTTVHDQARAMIDASEELQRIIADLVEAGASEGGARAAIEAVAVARLRGA